MLNVSRLRILRELHRRKTLAAVAQALSYSSSAVSQQIRQLEKEVGSKLVEPAGRRLRLTAQGLILVEHTEQILDLLERAEADVSASLEQPRGVVKVAAFQSAALTLVPKMITDLAGRHPLITVDFRQGEPAETLPALVSAELDLVIAEAYPGLPAPSIPGVTMDVLFEDPLWISMSAGMAAGIDTGKEIIAQLADAGWAMEQANTPPRVWVTTECRKAGFEPRVVCTSEDLAVQLQFVEAGIAVAVLPGLALAGASERIRRFPTRAAMQNRSVLLATRNAARQGSAVMAVSESLHRIAMQ